MLYLMVVDDDSFVFRGMYVIGVVFEFFEVMFGLMQCLCDIIGIGFLISN